MDFYAAFPLLFHFLQECQECGPTRHGSEQELTVGRRRTNSEAGDQARFLTFLSRPLCQRRIDPVLRHNSLSGRKVRNRHFVTFRHIYEELRVDQQ